MRHLALSGQAHAPRPSHSHAGEPCPHVDQSALDPWLRVVSCIAEHGARLEEKGADRERVASVVEVLEQLWRGARNPQMRKVAVEQLRALARHEVGLVQTALDLAESLAIDEAA